ncbi:MAG TPA: hypothetical protein VFJ96_15185, partial [Gemmatimonadaceae bacterium]|nr:hypothetical protein [Gemmatimonadaceae bacterium]
ALIGQTLPTIFISGIVVGVLVAGLALRGGRTTRQRTSGFVGGILVALLCGVAQFVIGLRIDRLLAAMGTAPDALPVDNPMRVAFGRLHGLSMLCLGLAALVALALLVVTLVAMRRDTQV